MAVEALSEESFPVIEAETEKRLCALVVSMPPTCCRLPMCVSLAPSTLGTSPNAAARRIGPFPRSTRMGIPTCAPGRYPEASSFRSHIDSSRSSMRFDLFPGPTDRVRTKPSFRSCGLLGFPRYGKSDQGSFFEGCLGCDGPFGFKRRGVGSHRSTAIGNASARALFSYNRERQQTRCVISE